MNFARNRCPGEPRRVVEASPISSVPANELSPVWMALMESQSFSRLICQPCGLSPYWKPCWGKTSGPPSEDLHETIPNWIETIDFAGTCMYPLWERDRRVQPKSYGSERISRPKSIDMYRGAALTRPTVFCPCCFKALVISPVSVP